jgi:hypothetical protein
VVVAGTREGTAGQVYNVHDDDLPTCREYLRAYKKHVKNIPSISVPYFGLRILAGMLARYHKYSKGQLPLILTPYKVASLWAGNHFDNSKLHSIGWQQLVPTVEGLRRSFAALRSESELTDSGDARSRRILKGGQALALLASSRTIKNELRERT